MALALGLVTPMSGLAVWAAELKGLELAPQGNQVQVTLDVDAPQWYSVHKPVGNSVTIVMPNAKLPEAFRGTGLPGITTPQGTRAEVTETPNGLHVTLHGVTTRPKVILRHTYDVATQAAPVPTLPKRPVKVRPGTTSLAAKTTVKRQSAIVAKRPVKPSVRVAQAPRPSAAKPLPKVKPVVAAAPAKPSPVAKPKARVTATPSVPMVQKPPEEAAQTAALQGEPGYNMMAQNTPKVVFEAESGGKSTTPSVTKSQPQVIALAPIPYQAGQYHRADQSPRPLAQVEHQPQTGMDALTKLLPPGLSLPVLKWGMASMAMVLGMLLMASFVAAWLIRRAKNQRIQTFLEEDMLAEDIGFETTPQAAPAEAPSLKVSPGSSQPLGSSLGTLNTAQSASAPSSPLSTPLLFPQAKSVSQAIHQSLAFKNPGFASIPNPVPKATVVTAPKAAPNAKKTSRFSELLDPGS